MGQKNKNNGDLNNCAYSPFLLLKKERADRALDASFQASSQCHLGLNLSNTIGPFSLFFLNSFTLCN